MAIKTITLDYTIQETQRFLREARELRNRSDAFVYGTGIWLAGEPLVAAATQASIDLTKELAKFHKGDSL